MEKVNAAGGVDGTRIELMVKDTGGSPEKAVSFAKQLIEEDKVVAIIGPSTSGESMQIKAAGRGERHAAPLLRRRRGHRQAGGQVRLQVAAEGQPRRRAASSSTMKKLGITKIGVLASNTGFGKAGKAQLEKLAPGARHHDRGQRGLRQGGHRPDRRGHQGEGGRRPGGGQLVDRAGPVDRRSRT